MDNDLEKIEEDLKAKAKKKKPEKISGKSVFDLQKIIIDKAKKEGNGRDSDKTVGGDE